MNFVHILLSVGHKPRIFVFELADRSSNPQTTRLLGFESIYMVTASSIPNYDGRVVVTICSQQIF